MDDENEVMAHFERKSAPSDVGNKKAFILRPSPHDADALTLVVPFVRQAGPKAQISLQLGIYAIRNGEKTFFGYRFESPEEGDEHHFHHAQPINAFGHGGPVDGAIAWYPQRYPSFPLAATNQGELVAALLVSISKWARVRELSTSQKVSKTARALVSQVMERIRPLTGAQG